MEEELSTENSIINEEEHLIQGGMSNYMKYRGRIQRYGGKTSWSGWNKGKRGVHKRSNYPSVYSLRDVKKEWRGNKVINVWDAMNGKFFKSTTASYKKNWWMLD